MTADRGKIMFRVLDSVHLFDPQVRLDAHDLVLKFAVKPAHHRKHYDQGHDPDRHTSHRNHGDE